VTEKNYDFNAPEMYRWDVAILSRYLEVENIFSHLKFPRQSLIAVGTVNGFRIRSDCSVTTYRGSVGWR
jgi:hypothetical protein